MLLPINLTPLILSLMSYSHPPRQLVQSVHSQLPPLYSEPNQAIFKPQTKGLMIPREISISCKNNLFVLQVYLHFFNSFRLFRSNAG